MSNAKNDRTVAHPENGRYKKLHVRDLKFDPHNPRLAEFALGEKPTQRELLRILWQHMSVDELAMSIAESGYFEHEPLLIVEEEGIFHVIEGNRRLAAVQLLLDPQLRKLVRATDLPKISKERADEISELPTLRTTRKDAWRFLGFKHVNGPSKWGSYAKARYIAEVHNEYNSLSAHLSLNISEFPSHLG